ncbi:methyl-accepting chemotaxis sensory transducer [Candidatus Moduliflexus flocculans]|uniref:Methyl-accepting chemotaxis sensory transducer n=1 Tax=Candidatus Moduliflexus flocculans TaxID=1499966 RepID=A0A0S6W3I4_9BACT|nr:methyl-accepting chemotaxis sensory transducer [Candidatus Moduliflexus flocculans]
MFHDLRIRTKLLIAFLIISIIPFTLIGGLAIWISNNALSKQVFSQLESQRDIKKTHIQQFFVERQRNMESLIETVGIFGQSAFEKMRSVQETKKAQVEEYFNRLRADVAVLATNVNLQK